MVILYEKKIILKLSNTCFFNQNYTGLCQFPSEIVDKQYEYFDGSATTKFTETHQIIKQELHASIVVTSFSCVERNGDFFIIG